MKDRVHCKKTICIRSSLRIKILKEIIQNSMQTMQKKKKHVCKSSMSRHRWNTNGQDAGWIAKVKKQISAQTKSKNVDV